LRIAFTEVADEDGFLDRVEMWNPTRTSIDTDSTSDTFLFVDYNRLSFRVH
jgi:hypothetical protein